MPSPTTFNITPAGIVYLLEGATLNYNLQSTYSLPVLVQVRSCIVPFLPQIADEIIAHVTCLQSANGGTGQGTLEINLIEIDKKPVFAADMFNYSVSEGTSAGALLASSQPISSSNPNTRNIPVYRLLSSNPPSSNFVLDPLSGQLSLSSVIVGGSLMFDATAIFALPNTYILEISAQVRGEVLSPLCCDFLTLDSRFNWRLLQVTTALSLFANATVLVTGVCLL